MKLEIIYSFAQWLGLADAYYGGESGKPRHSLLLDIYGARDEKDWNPASAYKGGYPPDTFAIIYSEYRQDANCL